jgi:DNA-binding transcriptional regulator WhiA
MRSGPPRRYSLDESYFDEIDSFEKAYWLGFIVADGSVSDRGMLSIGLKQDDVEHLFKFARSVKSDVPIKDAGKGCARINVCSRHMADALGRLGVFPRKTFTVEPWNGSQELMPAYWRGLFDGDGCIRKAYAHKIYSTGHARWESSNPYWYIGLVGNYKCVNAFGAWAREICESKQILLEECGESSSYSRRNVD